MNPLFKGITANDSKDLILFIFQELHKELNMPNQDNINNDSAIINSNNQIQNQTNEKAEYKRFKIDYYSQNNSIIQSIFYGEQESFSCCHNCKVKIFNFNIFNFLIFPLEKVRLYLISKKPNGFDKVTLEDCFDQYISEEIMSGKNQMYCNYCHTNSNYSLYNKIYKHPNVMVIILNRGKGLEFEVEFGFARTIKINNYINLENNPNYTNYENIEYELISIITHIGDNSMSGHFIAYCKSPIDNKWYLYNDAIVTECKYKFDELNNNSLKMIPYVLFYQIKNRNINEKQEMFNNIESNINSNSNQITLYFKFHNSKELYLDVDENMIFNEAILLLIKKNNLKLNNYKCFRKNKKVIDVKKTIKDNLLKNEDHIEIEIQ